MNRVRKWVRKAMGREVAAPGDPPLPFFEDSTPIDKGSATAQAGSAFFNLPGEIRLAVLLKAFGNCDMHMDLRFDIPRYTAETAGKPNHVPVHGGYPPLLYTHNGKPRGTCKAWRWYGCRCHRLNPRVESPQGILYDGCLWGEAMCNAWVDILPIPDRCFIGAMGFLLSCKQA